METVSHALGEQGGETQVDEESTGSERDFQGTERFVVQRRLGSGGMGVVYEAFDRERQARVAIKTLRSSSADLLYRFKAEFRALADIVHPNLVSLGELFFEDDQWFFTMELVEGVDFITYVRPGELGWFDEARFRVALARLVSGLTALHAAGKVHCDIKPQNVLVEPGGRVVLLDFGVVRELGNPQDSGSGQIVGTPLYMAPEQARNAAVGPEADWYAVGTMLYVALTGQLPFTGTIMEVLIRKQGDPPPAPVELVADLSPELSDLCMALLSVNPALRPAGPEILARLGQADLWEEVAPAALPTFVGREEELGQLGRALERSRQQAVSILVTGAPGLGRSALIQQFVQQQVAADPGLWVLKGRCYERESVHYRAFDELIDTLSHRLVRLSSAELAELLPEPREAAALARLFPVLSRVPPLALAFQMYGVNPPELRALAFAGLRHLLARLAAGRALILVVDDLHWADEDSWTLLQQLLAPPEAPRLLLLASAVGKLQPLPGEVGQIALEPLPPADARRLAVTLMAQTTLPPTDEQGRPMAFDVGRMVEEAGGHPLFLQELVASRPEGESLPLAEALWARIAALPEPSRQLLELLALTAGPFPQRVLADAAGLGFAETWQALVELRARRMVRLRGSRPDDLVEVYHERVVHAVRSHLPSPLQPGMHRRIAEALEKLDGGTAHAQALVRHHEGAGNFGRAAVFAERAAEQAARALGFHRAAELYRVALAMGDNDAPRARRLRRALAETLASAGLGKRAAAVYLEVAQGAEPAERLHCHGEAAHQLLGSGHIREGIALLEQVLEEMGGDWPASNSAALSRLAWNRLALKVRGTAFQARQTAEVPPSDLLEIDLHDSVATSMAVVDHMRAAPFQAKALRLALDAGERLRIVRALSKEACFLASPGSSALGEAWPMVEAATRLADEVGSPEARAWVALGAGITLFLTGHFRQARPRLDEAERLFRDEVPGKIAELSGLRVFRLFTLQHLGHYAELARAVPELLRDAQRRGDRFTETSMQRGFNVVWLLRDEPGEARAQLEAGTWIPASDFGLHQQHWYELLARAELALYEGTLPPALLGQLEKEIDAMAASFLFRAQPIRAWTHWLRGKLWAHQATRGSGGDRLSALQLVATCVRALRRESVPHAEVWASLLEACVAHLSGERDRAVTLLRAALEVAREQQLGSRLVAGWVLGEHLGGEQGRTLRRTAEEALRTAGVKNPFRFVRASAPWLLVG